MLTSYITIVQYQNQETGSGRTHTSHSDSTSYIWNWCVCVCVVLYNFTTCHFVQPPYPYYVTIRPSCYHFIATTTTSQPLTINNLFPNFEIMLFHEYYFFSLSTSLRFIQRFIWDSFLFFVSIVTFFFYYWVLFHGIAIPQFVQPR